MEKQQKHRCILGFILLTAALIILMLINVFFGSVSYSVKEIINALFYEENSSLSNILLKIRIPRLLAAIILGGALSVSGFLLQTFFSNPIAGPYVLGISSGAKLAVALTMVFSLQKGIVLNSAALLISSFIGSMVSMGLILLISNKVKNMSLLIVGGVMIGYICSAITDLVIAFADDSNIVNLHNWSMGTFSGTDMNDVKVMALVGISGVVAAFFISKPMGAYQLGESYAENMGVNIRIFRITLIILTGILSACVTAFAGPVSFVGIAVPHLVKSLFKTSRPIIIIPAAFLGGSSFCLLCDLIARTLFAPTEISISSVTAVFGAPVVIWIMLRKKINSMKG